MVKFSTPLFFLTLAGASLAGRAWCIARDKAAMRRENFAAWRRTALTLSVTRKPRIW